MFRVIKQEGIAKRGEFTTVHGVIQTPVFMNVGTVAAIKGAVSTEDLEQIGTQVELSNTYHLHVRPGDQINKHQLLFGINQGAIYEDIRIEHAKRIAQMDLDGYAVGGLAVGESHEQMYHILDVTIPHLPTDKPVYLMGVGTPANILEGVERGVDFFDCVYPSRNGRHGHLYTNQGKINLCNAKYELDERPIEEGIYTAPAEGKGNAGDEALCSA